MLCLRNPVTSLIRRSVRRRVQIKLFPTVERISYEPKSSKTKSFLSNATSCTVVVGKVLSCPALRNRGAAVPGPHKFARSEAGMTGGGQRVAKRVTLMFGLWGWDRND